MKQKGLKERAPAGSEQVTHLDEKLTDITTHTADALKKWGPIIIGAAIVILAVYVVYLLISAARESRREQYNQEIYELFHSPAARKPGYKVDKARLEDLIADVKGDPAEKMAVQEAVGWYLEYADRERKTQTIPGFQDAEGPISAAEAKEARTEAIRIASEAAERNPDDAELQLWAVAVKRKVEAEASRPWEKDKRKYMPPVVGPESSGTTPGASTSGGPASGDSAVPPKGAGEAPASPAAEPPAPPAPPVSSGAPPTTPAPDPSSRAPAGAQPGGDQSEKANP